ncbi:hypothetical protein [Virgibacillus natechei]|nr:hypothetical protein [Virgibacillus natechei]UZD12769.1 hypothetical protein OLD84_18065 [Virgibacillus natechei]
MVFAQLSAPISAQNQNNIGADKEVYVINGQTLEVEELKGEEGENIYHFTWENGSTEKLVIEENSDGEIEAKATGKNGQNYNMKKDLQGDVWVNDKKVIESDEQITQDLTERLAIQNVDPGGGGASEGDWNNYQTEYTSVSNIGSDVSTAAGLIALALGVGWVASALIAIVGNIVSKNLPEVWIKVDKYYRYDDSYNMKGMDRSTFYEYPDYTNYIGTEWSSEYSIR